MIQQNDVFVNKVIKLEVELIEVQYFKMNEVEVFFFFVLLNYRIFERERDGC